MVGIETTPDREASRGRGGKAAMIVALAVAVGAGATLAWGHLVRELNWDERFSLKNVQWALESESALPTWYYWYPPPSYLPQAWGIGAANAIGELVTGEEGLFWPIGASRPTRLGLGLARSFGITYGALTLLVIAALGARLGNRWSGGWAALLLATSPWFLLSIAGFKPDALLLASTSAGLLLLRRYAEVEQWRYLAAAAGCCGLAAAAKLNGGALSISLATAVLLSSGSWKRRVSSLAVSGAITIATFFVLNPFPAETRHYLQKYTDQYDQRAWASAGSAFEMLATLLGRFGQETFLGPLGLVAATAGLVILLAGARDRGEGLRRLRAWTPLLVFAGVNIGLQIATTRYLKENHLVPVLPILALLAASALAALRSAARRPWTRRVALLLPLVMAGLALHTAGRFVERYLSIEPGERLSGALSEELPAPSGRLLGAAEHRASGAFLLVDMTKTTPPATTPVTASTPAAELAGLDCVAGELRALDRLRLDAVPGFRVRRLPPPRWSRRLLFPFDGPLATACRPWRQVGPELGVEFTATPDGRRRARLPEALDAHDSFSVMVYKGSALPLLEVLVDGQPAQLYPTPLPPLRGVLSSTPRLAGPANGLEIEVVDDGLGQKVVASLFLWRGPQGSDTGAPQPSVAPL